MRAKPSLVCDVQEIFRTLIEEFLLNYHQNLEPDSFEEKGKRTFLNPDEKVKMIVAINKLFNRRVNHTRIKNFGNRAKIRTVIREEPIKLAHYIRGNISICEPKSLSSSKYVDEDGEGG